MYVPLKSFLPICIILLSLCNDNIISLKDRQLFQNIYLCNSNGITRFEGKRSLSPIQI